jgi:hypothetical protein
MLARVAVAGMVAAILPALPMSAANAVASNPGYTLEGCRQTSPPITFPDAGPFICPTPAYTTGNLGKGWNELDLVPHRVTLTKPVAGTVTLNLGGDHEYTQGSGIFGWDVVSLPVLNSSLSGTNCPAPSGAVTTLVAGSNGGAYDSIQRAVTFTGASNASANCVYDYYQRLALRSSEYSGSSLQSYVNSTYSGEKRVSIPVKDVLPQELRKTMSATQDSDFVWNVTKTSNPANLPLGNTCTSTSGSSGSVTITVDYTRYAAAPSGDVTVITNVYAKNPAARTVTVSVADDLRSGTTVLQSHSFGPTDIPAGQEVLVGTWSTTVPAGTTNINDIATATYTDKVTGVPINQTIQATATATVQSSGNTSNATATLSDVESITGTGLTFSVDSVTGTSGSFSGGYVAGTPTSGPVTWSTATNALSGSGQVVFNKTVYAAYGTSTTSGSLSDTATLTTSGSVVYTDSASTSITSSTSGQFDITKTIPNVLSGSETVSFTVQVATGTVYDAANVVGSTTFTFTAGQTSKTQSVTGLGLGSYVLHELHATNWLDQPDQLKTLSGTGASACVNTATFNNTFGPASATATKVTVPAGSEAGWSLTLTRPDASTLTLVTDATGGVDFGDLTLEGAYTITESLVGHPGWDQTGATGCSFTVSFPADADRAFVCTITNTQRGHIVVYKHTDPAASSQAFGFTANYDADGFSLTDGQSDDSGLLVPGAYNVAETGVTGWDLISSTCSDVAGHTYAPSAITLLAGETVTCHFTNRQRGHVRVVKTLSGAPITGAQTFTFQVRQGATAAAVGTTLESLVANSSNGGVLNFTTLLVPGTTYQICEIGMQVGWHSSLSDVAGAFVPGGIDNSAVCVNFTVTAGQTVTFNVDNTPPPGGDARTIGFWKNWSSCASSGGRQKPTLDRTLALSEPNGVTLGLLVLHGNVSDPNHAPSCLAAVRILNKSRVDTGAKQASDPAFGLAAQLLAAKLNIIAGAGSCTAANTAISQGSALLLAIHFDGSTHDVMTSAQKSQANSLASTLDKYNNNTLC